MRYLIQAMKGERLVKSAVGNVLWREFTIRALRAQGYGAITYRETTGEAGETARYKRESIGETH